MKRRTFNGLLPAAAASLPSLVSAASKTVVSIHGEAFHLNGKPTYAGRRFRGMKIEGLLMNSRMVQGVFDDRNPETATRWKYPDTGKWDAERNVREFLAAMPEWRRHGLLAVTVNFQGGSPEGYSKTQPWDTGGYDPDGKLRPAYANRMQRIIDRADELGMVVILGCFYFGQDQRLKDEAAVKTAVRETLNWVKLRGYRNVLLEIANECNIAAYDHAIIKPDRMPELIKMAKEMKIAPVGTSWGGNKVPTPEVTAVSDFTLIHGNGVKDPNRILQMVNETRALPTYKPMPILFNEDDHFDFDQPVNNFVKAVEGYASWGYFDPGKSDYSDGYQCPPVNWGINTPRKKAFFGLLKEMTGA